MEGFYVSIIFLGIILIVFSLVMIAYDRKKSMDNTKELDEKKNELVNIISDAEQMVEELNKFSDYVVTQMEIKNEELNTNLLCFEEKIKQINYEVVNQVEQRELKVSKVVNGYQFEQRDLSSRLISYNSDLVIENMINEPVENKPHPKIRDKVVPLNKKFCEVISLAEKGMNNTEIAKRMNMGKGEIELILGMNK